MTYTSDRPIYVDGVRLDTLAWNIEKVSRETAARRAADVVVPNVDGALPSLNDSLDPINFGLQMWLRGTDEDGAIPVNSDSRTLFRSNLDELLHLFGKRHALLEVREQAGPGEYVRNLATNPNWALATGPQNTNILANQIKNPLPVSTANYVQANGATITYDAAKAGIRVAIPAGAPTDVGVSIGVNGVGNLTGGVLTGQVWTFAVEVEAVTACNPRLSIQGVAATHLAGSSAWGQAGNPVSMAAGQTVRLVSTVTFSADGNPSVYVLRSSDQLAQEFIIRKVMMTRTIYPVDYFDGTRREGRWGSDVNTAWTAGTDASMSYVRANRQAVSSVSGVVAQGSSGMNNGVGIVSATSGRSAIRLVPAALGTTDDTFHQIGEYGLLNGFRNGVTYTLTATKETPLGHRSGDNAQTRRGVNVFYRTGVGSYTQVKADLVAGQVTAGAVNRLSVTWTAPASTTEVFVRLYHGGAAGDHDVFWRDLVLTEGPAPVDKSPVAGSEANTTDHRYQWIGTANDSISERIPRSLRRALAKVTASISPDENAAGTAGTFSAALAIPSGMWEDVLETDWNFNAAGAVATEVTSLTGSTERINDGIFVVTGPANNPRVTDPATGCWVQLNMNLAAGQGWRFNSATWSSRTGAGLWLSNGDTTGTDQTAVTTIGGPSRAYMLPLTPIRDTGARRVRVTLSATSGLTGASGLGIRARRKYA